MFSLPRDPAALALRLEGLGLGGPFTPIARTMAELVVGFIREEPVLIGEYLSGRLPAQAVASALIGCLGRLDPRLDQELFVRFIVHNDLASDQWTRERLKERGFQPELSLLGFGLGDGSFELELARWMTQEARLADRVTVWGFDTHQTAGGAVRMLTPAELAAEGAPRFDVVIARYVLHHVQPHERWAGLLACLHRCNPGATVLMAEQGYPAPTRPENTAEERYRQLLLVCIDVLANATLYPGWCSVEGPEGAPRFFVSYLSEEELAALERQMPPVALRELRDVGPPFPGTFMIRYELARDLLKGPAPLP